MAAGGQITAAVLVIQPVRVGFGLGPGGGDQGVVAFERYGGEPEPAAVFERAAEFSLPVVFGLHRITIGLIAHIVIDDFGGRIRRRAAT